MNTVRHLEKPSQDIRVIAPSLFTIGKDSQGRWAALDAEGRSGGLFINREAALKYVAAETGRHGAARIAVKPLSLWGADRRPQQHRPI